MGGWFLRDTYKFVSFLMLIFHGLLPRAQSILEFGASECGNSIYTLLLRYRSNQQKKEELLHNSFRPCDESCFASSLRPWGDAALHECVLDIISSDTKERERARGQITPPELYKSNWKYFLTAAPTPIQMDHRHHWDKIKNLDLYL